MHQRVLAGHLRTISFLDGMPNTALTSTVNPDEPVPLVDITIRAGVLRETGAEWMTSKERTLYDGGASRRSVSVEAGALTRSCTCCCTRRRTSWTTSRG